jgi:hypothetical protein
LNLTGDLRIARFARFCSIRSQLSVKRRATVDARCARDLLNPLAVQLQALGGTDASKLVRDVLSFDAGDLAGTGSHKRSRQQRHLSL